MESVVKPEPFLLGDAPDRTSGWSDLKPIGSIALHTKTYGSQTQKS